MTTGFRVIDLFAGAGGLSLGFHKAGLEGVFAVEKDAMAFETLEANLVSADAPYSAYEAWPDWVPRRPAGVEEFLDDPVLREGLKSLRGEIAVVAGGPPCQGFSVGGARNGWDERNKLVFKMIDVIEIVRPAIALIENVEGITRPFVARPGEDSATSVADQAVGRLQELGYVAGFEVLDTSQFGVPQRRRRTVIVGIQETVGVTPEEFFETLRKIRPDHLRSHGLNEYRSTSARDALEDLHNPEGRQPSPEWPKFSTAPYGEAKSAYARLMRGDVPAGSFADSHRFSNHGPTVKALFERAHETQPAGRLTKSFLLENSCKSDKKVLIDPAEPVSTLTSHPDEFIHYAEPRTITVREMARLQSFPDNFKFFGRYSINGDRRGLDVARCVQVGNAVPPLFAEALGTALLKTLS